MSSNSHENTNIKVFCRFQEMKEKEKELTLKNFDITSENSLTFHSSKENSIYSFNFDKIFLPSSTLENIYEYSMKNIIEDILSGYNGSIIFYGNNITKETNVKEKTNEKEEIIEDIIPFALKDIFNYISNNENINFVLKISIIEIHEKKIRDLINKNNSNLNIRKDDLNGINIEDLSEHYISNQEEIISLLEMAKNNKLQSYTYTNIIDNYCKSHFIFVLNISQINKKNGFIITSRLFFVDLGGIKNNVKSGIEGLILGEENYYDKSLIALKKVVNYLSNGKSINTPYKDSKLTQILQDCIGGNFKTNIIINCFPSINNELEIIHNLRFGEKIRKIKNKPVIKNELTMSQLKKLVNELDEKNKTKYIRIEQLEEYILFNDLTIPKFDENFQKIKKKKNIKNNNIENHIEEDLNKILELIDKNNIDINKLNLIEQIKLLKKKYKSNIKDLNIKIQSLQKEISLCNEIKYKLKLAIIEKQTRNENNDNYLNLFSEFFENMKKYKEIQSNTKILENFLEYETKIKNLEKEHNIIKDLINNNVLIIQKKNNEEFVGFKIEMLDKNIQTDMEGQENEKIQMDYEKDKIYLMQCLEKNKQIIIQLKNEVAELQNKNTILKNNENLSEKKIKDKYLILENNMRELKKKYEENQVKRLALEDNYRKLYHFFLQKRENLNNKVEIKEIKQKLSEPDNIIKVITGGKKNTKI